MTRLFAILLACTVTTAHAETAAEVFMRQSQQPQPGTCIELPIDLSNGPGLLQRPTAQGVELRYRMAWNNIAEGWSWQPNADPTQEDYYRYKYLPLQSQNETRGEYRAEDKIGEPETMQVQWRYDYFLAFDNLYAFYPRSDDDESGFAIQLPAVSNPVGVAARLCLREPVVSESTTFWKAIHARPTDFTLKKRYLIGELQAVRFIDLASGRELGQLRPQTAAATARLPAQPE